MTRSGAAPPGASTKRRLPDASQPAHPSLRRTQNPRGSVQTRGHAMSEPLRWLARSIASSPPHSYLTNMRASVTSDLIRQDETSMTVRVDEAGRSRQARFGERDLAGLIRIYEANYVRLARLVPDLAASDGVMVLARRRRPRPLPGNHRAPAVHDVAQADVPVRGRQRSRAGAGRPDQRLPRRAGRGARLPLAAGARAAGVRPWESAGACRKLDRKWRMNRFLLKWLRFCTFQGHLFIPGITPTLEGSSLAESLLLHDSPSPRDGAEARRRGD